MKTPINRERWELVSQLYRGALEREESRRADYLATACAGDEELRLEVESLLKQESKAQSFLEKPAVELAREAVAGGAELPSSPTAALGLGATISHYRVISKLGAGGMGVVYEAEDLKLGRHVALKFLPQNLVQDRAALERFKREAHAASALNHPNICVIHDVDEFEGRPFIVMERLKGETLKNRLRDRRSPLHLDEILDLGIQIADALDTAHAHGIVHRDIKPTNIFITMRDQAKILDFGLAKLTALAPAQGLASSAAADEASSIPASPVLQARGELPTATEPEHLTSPGVAMGTVAYMSPEQARGEEVDGRTDLFSFGAVLYEMATGQRAFGGEATGLIFAQILKEEPPPLRALNPEVPAKLEEIIGKCLEKDRELRCQVAAEIRADLKRLKRDVDSGRSSARPETDARPDVASAPLVEESSSVRVLAATVARRHKTALIAIPIVLLIVIAALGYWLAPPLPPPTVSGYRQLTHDGWAKRLRGTDGSRIYFNEWGHGLAQVSTRGGSVAEIFASSSLGLPSMGLLDVSQDGSKLLMATGDFPAGSLWAVPVLGGGSRIRLGDIQAHTAAWSPSGERLAYANGNVLYIANGDGSEPRQLAVLPGFVSGVAHVGWDSTPAWSPDASHISLTVADPKTNVVHLWEISADGKGLHPMFPGWHSSRGEWRGRWTPDGKYFVFESENQIWAVREAGSFLRKVSHEPVQLTVGTTLYIDPVPSKDGKEIFAVVGFVRGELNRYDGRTKMFVAYLGGFSAQDLVYSKDGQWVAYVSIPEGTLWRSRNDGTERLQLTFPPLFATNPRWSPDGKQIAIFSLGGEADERIYLVSPEGGTPQELMPNVPRPQVDPNWSPDGSALMFSGGGLGPTAIHIFNMSTHQITTLPDSQGLFSPRWSADGRYVAAITSPDMKSLMLFNFETGKWSLLFKADTTVAQPLWSRDGRYVYYLRGYGADSVVMRVAIPSGKVEEVVGLTSFHSTGHWGAYFGLAPDDSPLLLKDTGTQEIVSLDFHEP
jgi:eukaryotic-like serine/threonine-protein kinase